jgi:DNA repair protein RadC
MSFDSNVSSRDRQKILHINNDDIAITRAIVEAGKLLDIAVLDHLVIGKGRFVSLKERGLGFG